MLLFEMLSGHRPFEGSTTRALVQSVLETNLTARLSEIPNLSKPVRKILERALQKDRDKRFQSAGEFAEAVTSSAAYKLPKEVPVWAYAGLGVLFVAASAEAFVLSQKSGEVDGLNKQISAAQAEQLTAVQKAKDIKDQEIRGKEALLAEQVVKSDKLLGERDEWKNKYAAVDAQRIEIQGKYDTNVADAASKSTDKSQWDEQIADLKGQLQSERDAKSSLSERLGKLEDSEKTWKERASTAERARDEALKAASPQGQLAMTFDRICELAEKDLGQQALKTLLSAQDGGVFAKAGVDGADTVASLAQAAARVHTYHEALRSGGTAVLRDMVEARRFLDTAEKGGPSFALEAAGWIDFQFAGQEMQDRPKRALALSTRLKQDVGNALAASAKEDSADAAAIDLSKLASDASAIFAHEDKFACKDHLSRAAGVLVDQLRQQAAPGNVLDVERLRTFKTLPEFTQRLRQAQFALDASKTADLYAFEFAQRWYGEFNPTEKLEWNFAPPAVPSAPTSDWRSVMYLQWQLAGDKSNLPIKLGRSLLYRYSEPKKTPTWTRVSCRGSSRFVVEYQAYDDAGFQVGTADEREFEYVDGALRVKGSEVPIVDLHARGPSFSVVPFPVQSAELAIPSTLASEAELHKFREFLKAHPQACLAVKETGKDRWFSPEFGLVFDEIQGGLRRDLVSSTGVQ